MEKEKEQIQLPDNAFTELKPGEEYKPIMSPGQNYPGKHVVGDMGYHHGYAVLSRRSLSRTEGRTGV